MTEIGADQTKDVSEVKIFTVPFALEEIEENININSHIANKPSQEQTSSERRQVKPKEIELKKLLLFYQNRQFDKAEKLALSLSEKFPKHPFSWKVLGILLKQTGRIVESLIPTQKSVQLAPKDATSHFNLGNTLKELGRLEEAQASFKQAIKFKPDLAEAHSNLGNTLKELGRLEFKKAKQTTYWSHPFTQVGVLWNGDVTLCCLDHDGQLKVSNVRDSSIETVIQSEAAQNLRASMLGEKPLPSICQTCQERPIRN